MFSDSWTMPEGGLQSIPWGWCWYTIQKPAYSVWTIFVDVFMYEDVKYFVMWEWRCTSVLFGTENLKLEGLISRPMYLPWKEHCTCIWASKHKCAFVCMNLALSLAVWCFNIILQVQTHRIVSWHCMLDCSSTDLSTGAISWVKKWRTRLRWWPTALMKGI